MDTSRSDRWVRFMCAALTGEAAAETENYAHGCKQALAKTAAHLADYAEEEYQARFTDEGRPYTKAQPTRGGDRG